jgi:small neutral amino acid transporter SnatA (MarC family)
MLDASQILTLFFVTLGPLKVLGPFVRMTHHLDQRVARGLALRVFLVSVCSLLVAAFLGRALLEKWGVSIPALLIAVGMIFFLVAIRMVLAQYDPEPAAITPLPEDPWAATLRLTFPTVLTPYGVASVIALAALAMEPGRLTMILGLAVGVMALNLLAMMFARKIMRGVTLLLLQLLGAVLGVLQVALSIQIILWALQELGVLPV